MSLHRGTVHLYKRMSHFVRSSRRVSTRGVEHFDLSRLGFQPRLRVFERSRQHFALEVEESPISRTMASCSTRSMASSSSSSLCTCCTSRASYRTGSSLRAVFRGFSLIGEGVLTTKSSAGSPHLRALLELVVQHERLTVYDSSGELGVDVTHGVHVRAQSLALFLCLDRRLRGVFQFRKRVARNRFVA